MYLALRHDCPLLAQRLSQDRRFSCGREEPNFPGGIRGILRSFPTFKDIPRPETALGPPPRMVLSHPQRSPLQAPLSGPLGPQRKYTMANPQINPISPVHLGWRAKLPVSCHN